MNYLFPNLKPKEQKGSKPRCHLLTHGTPEQVAERLTSLIAPFGLVSAKDNWMPLGFKNVTEAQLHKTPDLFDDDKLCQTLESWWLAVTNHNPTTPNWDIASSCTIDGKRGLLLVETKAHQKELKQNDRCGAKNKFNYDRIGEAIGEAKNGLNKIQDGWNLSHKSHYQLCNRFAWSWKLATLGIPVALVYLGFLNANEMENPKDKKDWIFKDAQSWKSAVHKYAKGFVPVNVWGGKLMINDVPIYPIIHSKEIELEPIELSSPQFSLGL